MVVCLLMIDRLLLHTLIETIKLTPAPQISLMDLGRTRIIL